MLSFKNINKLRILCVFFIIGLLSTSTTYPYHASWNTIRVGSIFKSELKMTGGLIEYLQERCMVRFSSKTPKRGEQRKKLAWNMPENNKLFVYRGMQITIKSLQSVLYKGLEVKKGFYGREIYFTSDPVYAIDVSFAPLGYGTPYSEFLYVVVQADIEKIPNLEQGHYGSFLTKSNVHQDCLLNIFVFDIRSQKFVNISTIKEHVSLKTKAKQILSNATRFIRRAS